MTAHVDDRFCEVGARRLCYRTYGDAAGEPVLLIAGLGLDLTSWPTPMIHGLVDAGAHVVVFDNRDAGRTTPATTPPPSVLRRLLARPRRDGYDLGHMAADALALLDHLRIDAAHVLGMSMGGMIAQELASRWPSRVRTLTSIFSTTGARRVGQPARSTMLRLARRPARTRDEHVEGFAAMMRHVGGRRFPIDPAEVRAYAARAWDRGAGPRAHEGVARQINAIQLSGDRTRRLARIAAPTLVIHGDRDLLVAPTGGAATALAIPRARLVLVPGMEHYLADGVLPRLLPLIVGHLHAHPIGASRATSLSA